MKNPLVDALRQANSSGDAADQSDTLLVEGVEHDELLTANEDYPEDGPGAPEELRLLEADNAADEPAPAESLLLEDDIEEVVAEPDPELDPEPEEPAQIEWSASRELTATQALRQTSLAVDAPPLPLTKGKAMTGVVKLGVYSPFLCLALAAASAGLYLAWSSFGAAHQNSDLRTFASQRAQAEQDLTEIDATANPFPLILDHAGQKATGEDSKR